MRALIKRIFDNNPDDFYEKSYAGWYCVGCESFKQDARDRRRTSACCIPRARSSGWRSGTGSSGSASTRVSSSGCSTERPEFLQPESRRNEMLALLEHGLEDISASRSRFTWGVPFPAPLSTGEPQTTYVWFDALPNYLTATGFPGAGWRERWPAQLHVVGKDITRFHSIIWPAMLQAAEVPLPERVWAHGFVLLGGERFSKSAGVKLDLDEAIGRFGPDAFRYFLLREVPFDADGSFSWERFEERYNADLANALGNLASRTISMVERYCEGVVSGNAAAERTELDTQDAHDLAQYHAAMDGSRGYLLHEALRHVWADGQSRQRIRGPAGAVEAREGSGAASRAGEHARGAHPPARAPRDPPSAVHAGEERRAVATARRARCARASAIRESGGARCEWVARHKGRWSVSQRNRERRHVTAGNEGSGKWEQWNRERGTARRTTVPCSLFPVPSFSALTANCVVRVTRSSPHRRVSLRR